MPFARCRRHLAGVGLLAILVLVAPAAPAAARSKRWTLTGVMVLQNIPGLVSMAKLVSGNPVVGTPCVGAPDLTFGDYSDVVAGARVVVRDAKRRTIGTGALEAGTVVATGQLRGEVNFACAFPFRVSNLPRTSFYQIAIDSHPPGVYTYSELTRKHWYLELLQPPPNSSS